MSSPFELRSFARSHVGMVRPINEDRVLDASDQGMWAVADGMGGHTMGDVAAEIVVSSLADLAAGNEVVTVNAIITALSHANARVLGLMDQSGHQSGSTVAGLHIYQRDVIVFWVGDSRVYRLRSDKLELMTHDHRLVQELMDSGIINPVQARMHPKAAMITRAIGATCVLEVAAHVDVALVGDTYLICSDGLSDMIDDRQIALALADANEQAINSLISAALAAGGTDNISLVMVALGVQVTAPSASGGSVCATQF